MLKRFVKKLPGVLQTEVQKEFYAATFDQLFNSAQVEQAQGFIGRRSSNVLDPLVDNYLDEPNKNRAAYQLEPVAYAVNAALQDTNHMFYEDLLNYIKHRGGNVDNHDRLFSDLYYSFAPPIDVDKFLNYQNYLWLEATDQSNTAPIAFIQAQSLTGAAFDTLIESNIIGATSFNTSEETALDPQNFEFSSGMRVRFEGSDNYDENFYVECVGRSIRLVPELNTLGFDGNIPPDLSIADYITIERGSCEGSPWTRTNRWFHEDAVDGITALGQLLGGTVVNAGINYSVGDILLVNIGDGVNGSFVVVSAPGGMIGAVEVFTHGTGYSFAQADETGAVPAVIVPLPWDQNPPGFGSFWDPTAVVLGYATIAGQDETDFDNVAPNGTFFGGTGYAIGEVITMSDGSTITVDNVAVGAVTEFTITTISSSLIVASGSTLTTVTSDLGGNDDFTLTLDTNNEAIVTPNWDDNTIVTGSGSGAVIDGILAIAVSRSNKAARPILEFKKDLELFDFGNRFIGDIDVVAAAEEFADIEGQPAGIVVDGHVLVDGDTLIFLNPASIPSFVNWDDPDVPDPGHAWDADPWELLGASGAVTRFVWRVDLVTTPGTIALERFDPETGIIGGASPIPVGSVVLATQGDVYTGESFYQHENLLTDEYTWQLAQTKNQVNLPPLFQLYDGDGVTLNDTVKYPSSDFVGNEIYSYKVLTQERLIEQGGGTLVNDVILGFPLETQGFRQLGDVIFENDLEANRTYYIPTGLSSTEINGYYFYKQYITDPADCTILDEDFETNWKSSTTTEELRVIDRFLTTSDTEDTFPLSGTPVETIAGPANFVVAQGRRLNTSEFAYLPESNSMRLFAIATQKQGFSANGIQAGFVFSIYENFQLYVNGQYQVLGANPFTDYVINSQDSIGGTSITLSVTPPAGALVQATNQASGAPGVNKVVELLTYTFDPISDSQLGYFEVPNELENNPNNNRVLEQSWNEFTPHYTSIITEQQVYEGTAFGAGNNYRDTLKDGSLGTFILQNQSPLLKTMLCTSSEELDMIDAMRLSSNEYTRYKNKFIRIAGQLINEGFTPQEVGSQIPTSEWVDEAIRRIIRAREYDTAFNDTYMVAWNTVYEETEFTATGSNSIYTITDFVDLTDKKNVMYVYIDEALQVIGRDYVITNYNPIQIATTSDASGGASVVIRIFGDSAPAHIPATPSKLGLYTAFEPSIIQDDTYVNPVSYILGHDGSRTPIYNSVIDEMLLEFETRIYNGIIEEFRTNDYKPPMVIDTYKPGKFRETRWSLDQWNDLIKQSFYKWVASNKADYITNGYYDSSDSFTWNYETVVDIDGESLAGYWRGIFDYYYDTQTPQSTPWEMLGFDSKPVWWDSTDALTDGFMGYGPGPWGSGHPMWADLEAGLIRRVYDIVTDDYVVGAVDSRYTRTGLVASLPVDIAGALKASPLLVIDTSASLVDPDSTQAADDYNWTDMAPVEYAWVTSESYPFAVCEAMFLARPGEFGEKMWDPEHIYEVPVDNEQIVSDDNDIYKRIGNSGLVVHGETVGGVKEITTGYQVWISGRLKALKKDISTDFGNLIRTLDVKLGHKMAGFTDKDTLRVFVEGISVTSQSSNLLVPAENIDVALYTGSPVQDYFYGGVLIKALANDQYQVFGYDITAGEFIYTPRVASNGDTDVTVGGKPESFTQFTVGTQYALGVIVRLNGIFYRCIQAHLADSFDPDKWLKLAKLPILGGVSATYRKRGADSESTIVYGHKFSGVQEVFDFLVGYGESQTSRGWTFETVNTANNTINNWLQAAKDYLFWVGTQWEVDSLIMLSPMAEKVILNAQEGYPANVEKIINGVYNILDKNGVAIDPINTVINRDDRLIEVEPDIAQTGIYGLRVVTRETENIITFDNVTVFNDILYDPVLGSRLARLDFRGRRTLDWTGKLEAAGFIITADGLLPNYENMVDSIRNYHNTEVLLDNPQIEVTARHLIGFDDRDYFTDLGILDDVQYQFYQGMVRQKGTRQSVEKMERNKLVTNTDDELNIIEEWALKLDEFAGVCINQYTEFLIAADEVKVDPQLVQLSYPASQTVSPTYAFDSVNSVAITPDNTITIEAHGYKTAEPKKYNTGGGTAIAGLSNNGIYYVIVIDEDTFQLALTLNNAIAITPVPITLTSTGVGTAHTLTPWPTGVVTSIDVVSATNVYIIPPTVFITNHPDDLTGAGATAVSVLDTDGTVLRADIITQGSGYSLPPQVAIGVPVITTTSDRATSQIEFAIATDIATDDVILIDIDDSSRWITKPGGVACDVAGEVWPESALGRYNTPNAGYVHAEDVDYQAFFESSIDSLSSAATIPSAHSETIWVARDARDGFAVFFMDNYKAASIVAQDETVFDGVAPSGTWFGGTDYTASEVIVMSDGTTVAVDTVDGNGAVLTFDITGVSTTAFAARANAVLTAVSSNGIGNNDFTLTMGIANEETGALLPGIGATLTQTPVTEDDGRVTFTSIPREDVVQAQFTIDVDGNQVDGVTVTEGGFGYTRDGEFTITDATHGLGSEQNAVIEYQVTNGIVTTANVKVGFEGVDYFVKIDTAIVNVQGAGYSLNDTLSIVGGTGTAATLTVSELSTIAAQDETVFNDIPSTEGTFTGGTLHTVADVITLTDGSTITVDEATGATIAGQTDSNFDGAGSNGTYVAGNPTYVTGDIITMSDGTVVQVDAAGTPAVPAAITAWHIVSASTAITILPGDTLTSAVNPGSTGTGFTMTLGTNNLQPTALTGVVTQFTVTTASITGIITDSATVAQVSTTGGGEDFALNLGPDNQAVFDVIILTQGEYVNDASLPLATAATTVVPTGGVGATIDLTFLDDGIVVSPTDVSLPTGWRRYMGNSVPNSGQIYAGNVVYDYTRVSGAEYILSNDGTPIENGTLSANTPYFTLMNLRFRTIAERTIFEPDLILVGATQVWTDNNGSDLWSTDIFDGVSIFTQYRVQEELIQTDKFVNAYVYDHESKDTLAQIPVYDPFKGIIPGNADQNITYKRVRDPARYTNSNDARLIDPDRAFDGDQVGQLWWDTSTSAYLYYEQGSDTYRRDNWGRLFSGSDVDIYEWTRSTVAPASYSGDGTVRNTTDYVEIDEWNSILEQVDTYYYFWVKDRTDIPGGANRTIAAFEVANIITNPTANLYQWFSPVSQTGFMFAGVDSVFTDSDNVFQINYRRNDIARPTHVEWELGREGDPSYVPNDIHWNKMVDSLVGYTVPISIGAMAYTDNIATFNTDATGVDAGTELITTLEEHGFTDGDGVRYSKLGGVASIGLTNNVMYYVEVASATTLYLHRENHEAAPIPPTLVNPATRVNLGTSGAEVHQLTGETMTLHNFNNALPTAADPTMGYLIVPDPALSDDNKLGIRTRPRQSMFDDIQAARRVWTDKINELVSTIALRDSNPTWNASMTTNTLWEWIDWYAVGFDATNAIPVRQVDDASDLAALPNPLDGDIVKVLGTRYSLYAYSADTGLYTLVMREDTRLNLLSDIYEDDPSLEASLELRELIYALQTQVFVNDLAVDNNLVFFTMLNYVFSEQEDLDWAFKTTYIFIDQTGQVLSQPRVFQEDPFDSALQYINEVKPYQTKVRDYRITRATELDELPGSAEDLSRNFTVSMVYDQIRGGDLSVTEMRIAKFEGQQSTSYKGYSTLDSGTTQVRLGAAGRAVNNQTEFLADIQGPDGPGTTLAEFDPGQTGFAVTTDELEAVAAINTAITSLFFFDFQGTLLQNTSFGGYPTLQSYTLGAAGAGYVVGDILQLDAGSGTPISNATFRVSATAGSPGPITALDLIDGGSYLQTPTVDPVNLNGGTGTGANVTMLVFENGSSVPHDTTPWDQIGFESSAFDPSVTVLDGTPNFNGTFDDIPAEETFSGNGSVREFAITTTVPTFFMFVVVDGVEKTLNVDYFFIGTTLVFITAPPSGSNNIELYTYIEAGDLINPQVTAGITEEMVPLDPRENLIVIADTHNISLAAQGTGYAVGEILTLTAGTFTTPATVQVTAETGGIIDSIVLVNSGEYTVLPGVASAVTSDLAGNDDATVTVTETSLSFRIHHDTLHNQTAYRNLDLLSTTLTASLAPYSNIIPVANVTDLYSTPPTRSAPQVAWIGTERIIYHGVNLAANELTGVIRGTNGTHAAGKPSDEFDPVSPWPVTGTKVFGIEGQAIPSPNIYWVNTATAAYHTGTDGNWRYNGAGFVHFSDDIDLTLHTTGSVVVGDTLRVTTGTVVNKSYFIKELILDGEVNRIDVVTPGTGYEVGDAISLAAIGGAAGATAEVGGIDVNGGITYVTITNRGVAGVSASINIGVPATGDGNANIDVYFDREGLVLAQTGDIINPSGVVVERNVLTWFTDGARPGGLAVATTAAGTFINGGDATLVANTGNALSIPAV